ncbi:MAG: ZIP family metal transporter [Thermoleophilia bacterium]
MAIIFTLFTFVSTLLGGLLSIRFKSSIRLILAFTAGVILGLVFFDIIPEIFSLLQDSGTSSVYPMAALIIGILIFHNLEQVFLVHHGQEEHYNQHKHPAVGLMSASALVMHSFFDGVGIGLGFQISSSIGVLVAIAVIGHDFSDGLNTGSLMIFSNNSIKRTRYLIVADALAPVIGAASTLLFTLPHNLLVVYLGFFAGFLIYISLEEILPEAHRDLSLRPFLLTGLGIIFIFLVTQVAR